jgi:hypothetical protein
MEKRTPGRGGPEVAALDRRSQGSQKMIDR